MGGAIVWLLLVPVGVPAFFTWLLHRFRVPQMARRLEQNAWLRAAMAHAWREGLAQPPGAAALAVDTIPARHLEALYALFVCGRDAEEASDILAGKAPPVTDEDADETDGADAAACGVAARITPRLRSAWLSFTAHGNGQRAEAAAPDEAAAAAARREFLLAALLRWCETSGVVSIPVILWELADAEEEAAELQDGPPAPATSLVDAHRPAAASELRSKDVPQLVLVALKECGYVAALACGLSLPQPPTLTAPRDAQVPHRGLPSARVAVGKRGAGAQAVPDLHLGAHRARERGPDRGRPPDGVRAADREPESQAVCCGCAERRQPDCAAQPLLRAAGCTPAEGARAAHALRV